MEDKRFYLVKNPKPPEGLDANILQEQTKELHNIALLLTHLEDAARLIKQGSLDTRNIYAQDLEEIGVAYSAKFEADLIELNNNYSYYQSRSITVVGEGFYWRLGQFGVEEIDSNAQLDFKIKGGFVGFERFNSEGLCLVLGAAEEGLYFAVNTIDEITEASGFG